jgi:hypothetical protein
MQIHTVGWSPCKKRERKKSARIIVHLYCTMLFSLSSSYAAASSSVTALLKTPTKDQRRLWGIIRGRILRLFLVQIRKARVKFKPVVTGEGEGMVDAKKGSGSAITG